MPSLFDTPDTWRRDPSAAFEAFVLSPEFLALSKRKPKQVNERGEPVALPPIRGSSAKIYILMFGRFLRWMSSRNKTLFDVSSADLIAFLQQGREEDGKKVLNGVIRFQYLGLLDRVYTHLQMQNPVQEAFLVIANSGNRALLGKNQQMVALTDAEQAAFMLALPQAPIDSDDDGVGWKKRRDRAMQAMMLGAGLKVVEVIGLYTENVGTKDSTGSVPVSISPASAGGVVRWHQTQLRPFAVPEVMRWVEDRMALKIAGPLLFPASLGGGRLNKATVYRQVRATFERAGIVVERLGGRTLRNAFAVRELKDGGSIELVGEFMGHRKRRSIDAYAAKAFPSKVGRVAGEPE